MEVAPSSAGSSNRNAEARSWLLDRKIIANEVGPGFVQDTRA
jgi:hypothetical protein